MDFIDFKLIFMDSTYSWGPRSEGVLDGSGGPLTNGCSDPSKFGQICGSMISNDFRWIGMDSHIPGPGVGHLVEPYGGIWAPSLDPIRSLVRSVAR